MFVGTISQKRPMLRGTLFGPARQILREIPPEGSKLSLAVVGLTGRTGLQGQPGAGIQDDPGDFTLIFDNHLI